MIAKVRHQTCPGSDPGARKERPFNLASQSRSYIKERRLLSRYCKPFQKGNAEDGASYFTAFRPEVFSKLAASQ